MFSIAFNIYFQYHDNPNLDLDENLCGQVSVTQVHREEYLAALWESGSYDTNTLSIYTTGDSGHVLMTAFRIKTDIL